MPNIASILFTKAVENNFDYQCPATQDAIDRLVAAEGFRSRGRMIEAMRGNLYTALDFNSSLLSAWKSEDIKRATGQSRDWWLDVCERIS